MKFLGKLRGPHKTLSWEFSKLLLIGHVDADILGFHWTLWAYGWPGRQICIAQGRAFTLAEAEAMLTSHAACHRWMLERRTSPPPGVKPEFNFRRWFCDFFRIP